jgi:hypothetical protein
LWHFRAQAQRASFAKGKTTPNCPSRHRYLVERLAGQTENFGLNYKPDYRAQISNLKSSTRRKDGIPTNNIIKEEAA